MNSVLKLLAIAFALVGFFSPSKAFAYPADCSVSSGIVNCTYESSARAACAEDASTQQAAFAQGSTHVAHCTDWAPQRVDCLYPVGGVNGCYAAPRVHTWTVDIDCPNAPDKNIFTGNPAPASVCQDYCNYTQSGGVGTCFTSSNTCLTPYTADGTECAGPDDAEAPDGCTLDAGGSVTCDCSANPSAPFCPGGAGNDESCNDNGDGTTTCANNPYDTNDPGSGGSDGDPSNSDGPGSCSAGDPNCSDSTGGTCDPGEVCTTDDGVEDGADSTCDPLTENCDGLGTAGTAGSCDSEPSCAGDAIQCAILLQSWKNTCMVLDTKGEKPPWESDPDYGRDLADESQSIDISTGLDDAGFATGSCPANSTISVFGSDLTIDFVPLCDLASIVRIFVILFTLLWAGPYVIRSFG